MFTKFRNPYTEDKVFDIQKGFINILHDICELNEIPDTISEICETVISDIGKQTSFTDSIINAHNAFLSCRRAFFRLFSVCSNQR